MNEIFLSGSAPESYPADTFFAFVYYGNKNDVMDIPKRYPYSGEWGQPLSTVLLDRPLTEIPSGVDMVWLSIPERQFYSCELDLDSAHLQKLWQTSHKQDEDLPIEYIIVGMAPGGGVAIWFRNDRKQIIAEWTTGETTDVEMEDFLPANPTITVEKYCDNIIKDRKCEGYPTGTLDAKAVKSLYVNYMRQFSYRYICAFEHWDSDKERWEKVDSAEIAAEFGYIEESLYDGTYDKLRDGGLMRYHSAGKPKKLRVHWRVGNSEYSAHFWFEDDRIRETFDRFFGAHPETKTDFIIRIDAEQKKYELALYRYGLKEPQVIAEDVYQLIVFKNKFEDYRSDNYNQERGAWIW